MSEDLASKLREQIRVERPLTSMDGQGGRYVSWQEVATIFAQVVPLQNVTQETLFADQPRSRETYRMTVRYRADIGVDMRVIWRGKTLLLSAVYEDHQARGMLHLVAYQGGRQ